MEEQFYIVWPLVVWLLPENAILTLCTVGLVVALPLRVMMVHKFAYTLAMALTTSRMDGLLVGVILAILLRRGQIPLRWICLCMGVGAGSLGSIAAFHHTSDRDVSVYADNRDHWICIAVRRVAGVVAASHRVAATCSGGAMAANRGEIQLRNVYLSHSRVPDLRAFSVGAFWSGVSDAAAVGAAVIAFLITVTFLVAKISYDLFESKILALKIYFRPRYAKSADDPWCAFRSGIDADLTAERLGMVGQEADANCCS